MDLSELRPLIEEAGAVRFGVAPLQPVETREFEYYRQWLAQGRHGSMSYLANHLDIRRNPALLLTSGTADEGGTILSCAFPYFNGEPYISGKLRFARYSLGDDYHEVLRQRLRPVATAITAATGREARICVDSAPILERYWAVKAGLGYIGRNRQLIVPGIGSHLFLAEIVTHALISDSAEADDFEKISNSESVGKALDRCLECGKCQKGCPLGALSDDGFDACRCLSYLTIENRDPMPGNARKYFYGCDICLDACPQSVAPQPIKPLIEFLPREELLRLTPARISEMTQEEFSALFRHSAIKRVKLAGLRRLIN